MPCGIGICYDAFEVKEGTKSLADYDGDEFGGLSVVAERRVGQGRVILVGSVICPEDLLRIVGKKTIAEASRNIILTARTGKENGIIAVETENREGYVVLDGEYFDLLTEKTYKDKIEMAPYSVAVLQKKSADTSINR